MVFLLPAPLLQPSAWPGLDGPERWLLSLDVVSALGGPLRARAEELIRKEKLDWFLPSTRFLGPQDRVQDEIRVAEMRLWLAKSSSARLYSSVQAAPTFTDWAREIFPTLTLRWGEMGLREKLREYGQKFRSNTGAPWEDLRFFAGSLRQEPDADVAVREWVTFQVLYSPQDEGKERASLAKNTLILNPTAQIVRNSQAIEIFVREGDRVVSHEIEWREALLIDEVSESPRKSLAQVSGEFIGVLDALVNKQIILRGV